MRDEIFLARRRALVWGAGLGATAAAWPAMAARSEGLSDPAQTASTAVLSSLHDLDVGDGTQPLGPVVQGPDGRFYGTSSFNGQFGKGSLWAVDDLGQLEVLHHFSGAADGEAPYAGLLLARDGAFYGSTLRGGSSNRGVLFRLSSSGQFSLLHEFAGGAGDGSFPRAELIQAQDGRLFGSTFGGGAQDRGCLFRIGTDGRRFKLLHSFDGSLGHCDAPLLAASDGWLYGTSSWDGSPRVEGVVFRLSPRGGALQTLFRVTQSWTEFAWPGALVEGPDGWFYGASMQGGQDSCGTLFKLNAQGEFQSLFQFPSHGRKGLFPVGDLCRGRDGQFYGTARLGGESSRGVMFRLSPGGKFKALASMASAGAGYPSAGVIQATDGRLIGTTEHFGSHEGGTVVQLKL